MTMADERTVEQPFEPSAAGEDQQLLRVRGLRAVIDRPKRVTVAAVQEISLTVGAGEVVALVGETGSGKSLTALSIMRLLRSPVRIADGEIDMDGTRLTDLSRKEMRALRGSQIGMVFQDPMTALNPFHTVGAQIAETISLRRPMRRPEMRRLIIELLTEVGIVNPGLRIDQYPHELSGGTQQRVMIAMALANRPRMLIADEPTTGIDATIQAQILALVKNLAKTREMGVLIITHDLGVVASVSDRTVVMYGGEIIESGPTSVVLKSGQHPYTRALLGATPRLEVLTERLAAIPGSPPDLFHMPSGCRFHPRCHKAQDRCRVDPPLLTVGGAGGSDEVRCWFPMGDEPVAATMDVLIQRTEDLDEEAVQSAAELPEPVATTSTDEIALQAEDVHRHFAVGHGHRRSMTKAVDGVSLEVRFGETVGLVGESGCGKSTFAKILADRDQPTSGRVVRGTAAVRDDGLPRRRGKGERGFVQFVFQDTFGSLDPRRTVGQTIGEPLQDLTTADRRRRRELVLEYMAACGLPESVYDRYPHELSGGQRQRVGICRALVVNPAVVVMDEPMSGLDVSVQAQIVNLLQDLRSERGLTSVIVSHDVGVIRQLCDRIGVMYLGRLVEWGTADEVLGNPMHPYTAALISAVPSADPVVEERRAPILLRGDLGEVAATTACPFAPRCPATTDKCLTEVPPLAVTPSGALAACHFPGVLGNPSATAAASDRPHD